MGLPECGGKVGSPCSPAEAGACRTWVGLAAQPAQDVRGLNVLSTLDVLTRVDNAPLELRFERWWRRRRQAICTVVRQLAEQSCQFATPLLSDFASDQCAFRLKVPQGTPPL